MSWTDILLEYNDKESKKDELERLNTINNVIKQVDNKIENN